MLNLQSQPTDDQTDYPNELTPETKSITFYIYFYIPLLKKNPSIEIAFESYFPPYTYPDRLRLTEVQTVEIPLLSAPEALETRREYITNVLIPQLRRNLDEEIAKLLTL